MTIPMIMDQIPNWSISIMWKIVSGCWNMVRKGFHLATWTTSWLKHGMPSRCQLETSSRKSYPPPPLSPPYLTTNTQECAASVQLSSGAKSKEINNISRHTVSPIKLQVTSTDDTMVVLREKGMQRSSRNIFLRAAAYDAARKRTVNPSKDMNK